MAQNPTPEYYAAFTDDLASTQPIICGRVDCSRQINPGEPRYSVGNQNINGLGRIVCEACNTHYKAAPSTIRRSRATPDETDVEDVHRQVINARKKDATGSDRRITAVPHFNSYHVPAQPGPGLGYPRVNVPSLWNGQMLYPMPAPEPSGYRLANGYSAAHTFYESHRAAWAKKAYQGNPAETIGILMQVLHEVSGKPKGVIVKNLSEGKEITANATPAYLMDLVIKTMAPKLLEAPRYNFNQARFTIRDVVRWVNLADESPNTPWFYDRCLVSSSAKSKDKTRVFKRPKNPLTVALVLDAEEWETYLECTDTTTNSMLNQMTAGYSQQSKIASSARSVAGRTARLSVSDWDANSVTKNRSNQQTDINENNSEGTSNRPSTPPPSKKRNLPEYISPDRSRLRKALAIGGASDISKANNMHTSERIEFYQLKQIPLHELLGSEQAQGAQFFTCDPSLALQGSMVVEFTSVIGTGTFKTAHRGHLSLIHLPLEGLGTTQNELVAVKRMYRKQTKNASGNRVVSRFPYADEYSKTVQEANLLYWASSLMDFAYSAIALCVSHADEPPPFTVPKLRFVHAGVAVSHDQASGTNISNTSSIRRTYLVEEFIEDGLDGFTKFVHNGNPQIMTSPYDSYFILPSLCLTYIPRNIAKGTNIFGEGNVGDVFEKFPEQHICNTYCKWFKLPFLLRRCNGTAAVERASLNNYLPIWDTAITNLTRN
ncbi:hypothetical protein B0H13DRAFT_1862856 [Mycena leptocephala]|nr:hypothetical protein B0H13DRAFT_1862856 [Mycena leptocephala]